MSCGFMNAFVASKGTRLRLAPWRDIWLRQRYVFYGRMYVLNTPLSRWYRTAILVVMKTEEAAALIKSVTIPLHRLGVRRVALFGSTIRGDARPDSDVDLLLEFQKGRKTFDSYMDAADILEEVFPVPVDILTPESFNDQRRARIQSEAVYFEIQP